jgi:hypothetical protein
MDKIWLDDAAGPKPALFAINSMCLLCFVFVLLDENSCIVFTNIGFNNKIHLIFIIVKT